MGSNLFDAFAAHALECASVVGHVHSTTAKSTRQTRATEADWHDVSLMEQNVKRNESDLGYKCVM
jgi:hypothetical protein